MYLKVVFLTQTGSTALFSASQNGHTVIVNTLLAFGADMNIAGFKVYFLIQLGMLLHICFMFCRKESLLMLPD